MTSTVIRLVPIQARDIAIVACGPDLPSDVPQISPTQLLSLPHRMGAAHRVWHARRNVEMLAGLALKKLAGKKLKLVFTSAAQRRHSGFTRMLIRQMDAIIATSQAAAGYLEREATVIRHGVDCAVFHPVQDRAALRAQLSLPAEDPLVGCFGRIRPQKGTDVLIDAICRVFREVPNANALIMGRATAEHAAYLKSLKTTVDEAGLSQRVLFRDEVPLDQLASHFQALDLYVAPQRWEGFGLTPLEAMACGVPVVATKAGAFEELVIDGQTGHLIDVEDPIAMAQRIRDLLADPLRRVAYSVNARAHMLAHFTIEAEAAAINEVYRKLLASE
ncbi:MAG: glycosyltransferase family 4 protein [Roseobacter sp.]